MADLPDALPGLLARWGISADAQLSRPSRGSNNRTLSVAHGDGHWALRISENLSADQVRAEHRLLTRLRAADLPFAVPEPVATLDGDTLAETAVGAATLCRWIGGVRPDLTGELTLERFGRAIGILDAALQKVPAEDAPQDWRGEPPQIHPAVPDTGDLCLELAAAGVDREQLVRLEDGARRMAASWSRIATEIPVQVVHGDLGASNTLVDERSSAVTGLLDFEIAGTDFWLQDLAAALLLSGALEGDGWQRRTAALVRGYGSVRPLGSVEIQAVPDLLAGRSVGSVLWRAGRWRRGQDQLSDVADRLAELDATTRWLTTCGGQLLDVLSARAASRDEPCR